MKVKLAAEMRLIQADGCNSSIELDVHDENGRLAGTRKSYDPEVIEAFLYAGSLVAQVPCQKLLDK